MMSVIFRCLVCNSSGVRVVEKYDICYTLYMLSVVRIGISKRRLE